MAPENLGGDIEVKTRVGDQRRIDLLEAAVRAARDQARSRSNMHYVVEYAANPQDPANAHMDVLPNPMRTAAEDLLELLGRGVCFGFQRL